MNTDKLFAETMIAEYAPVKTRKVIALRKLDRWIKRPAVLISYVFGVIMTALLIAGIAVFVMKSGTTSTVAGVILSVVGFVGITVNNMLHNYILDKVKEKNAVDIIVLSEQIIEDE